MLHPHPDSDFQPMKELVSLLDIQPKQHFWIRTTTISDFALFRETECVIFAVEAPLSALHSSRLMAI
jgi:hypothetical protein